MAVFSRRLLPIAVLGLALALAGTVSATGLELLRTIGDEDGEIQLYRPEQVAYGADGSIYLLNGGDCTILHFDPDWTLLDTFARCGQGPGEFETATGMSIHGDRLWVFEMGRATLFDLQGGYVETRRSLVQMQAPVFTPDGILCRLGGSDRAAGLLDENLELVRKLGPECVTDDFFESYKTCGFMYLMLHPDWLCLLLNPIDGRLFAVDAAGDVGRTVSLIDAVGHSNVQSRDDTVTMSFSLVQGLGCVDDRGYLWSLPFDAETAEDAEETPQVIEVRDRDFRKIASFDLPEGVGGVHLLQTPESRLLLLDSGASLIHLLAYPDLP